MAWLSKNPRSPWPEEGKFYFYEALDFIEENYTEPFPFKTALGAFSKHADAFNASPSDHLRQELRDSPCFGYAGKSHPYFYHAESLTRDVEFTVTPTRFELANKALILEERLLPFSNPRTPQKERKLLYRGEPLPIILMDCHQNDFKSFPFLFPYGRFYLGKNFGGKEHFRYMELHAADLNRFLAENDFKLGDKILFKVKDHRNSVLEVRPMKKEEILPAQAALNRTRELIRKDVADHLASTPARHAPHKSLLDGLARLRRKKRFPQGILPGWSDCFLESPDFKVCVFPDDALLVPGEQTSVEAFCETMLLTKEKMKAARENIDELSISLASPVDSCACELLILIAESEGRLKRDNPSLDSPFAQKMIEEYFDPPPDEEDQEYALDFIHEFINEWREGNRKVSKTDLENMETAFRLLERVHELFWRLVEDDERNVSETGFFDLVCLRGNLYDFLADFSEDLINAETIRSQRTEFLATGELVFAGLIQKLK